MKANRPTKGSVAILNASAAKGSETEGRRTSSSSVLGLIPLMASTSVGEGRNAHTASKTACTPLFLKEEPHIIGTNFISVTAPRTAARISSASMESGFSKYFSISVSSYSATSSSRRPRHSWTVSTRSAGIGMTS